MNLRKLRLRAVWLLVLPFFWFATPTGSLLGGGIAIALLGLAIRAWSAGTIHKDKELTTSGPYAFTRNPLYLGSLFIGIGLTLAGGHWLWPLLFTAFFATVYVKTIQAETRLLTEVFGERYAHYAAGVPVFVPRLSPYVPASGERGAGFSWSQYRRNREWEAALGGVAAFGLLAAKLYWGG